MEESEEAFPVFAAGSGAFCLTAGPPNLWEEALFQAAKQIRPGQCSHCQKGLHFYRECLDFWSKVMESCEAKSKEAGN